MTSANDGHESVLHILPERRVELRWRQIEHGGVGPVQTRDDECVYEATNAARAPANLDVVERDVPEDVVQSRVHDPAAAGQLRQCRYGTSRDHLAHEARLV